MSARNVLDYGARPSSDKADSAINTAAIQAAIDAGPGDVVVPAGDYFHNGLFMQTGVRLFGEGALRSYLRTNDGVSHGALRLASLTTNHTTVENLTIRGNRYGGGGGGTAHGIHYVGTEDSNAIRAASKYGFTGDAWHRVKNVEIRAIDGTGLINWTRAATFDDVMIEDTTGYGVWQQGSDGRYNVVDANWTGRSGFFGSGGNCLLQGCKAWYSGGRPITPGDDPSVPPEQKFSPEADGYLIEAGRWRIIGCEAQDTSRHAMLLRGADYTQVSGLLLDNIGNLYAAQGNGYPHGPVSAAVVVVRRTDPNHALYNKLDFVLGQRSSATNIRHFINFGTSSSNNRADFTGNPAHILTERPVLRSSHETTFNNIAHFNNEIA